MLIKDIAPIRNRNETQPNEENLADLVEAPLLEACRLLVRKNIRTLSSSANREDVGGNAHIMIDADHLSEDNLRILRELGAVEVPKGHWYHHFSLKMSVDENTTAAEVAAHFLEIANRLQAQAYTWAQRTNFADLIIVMDPRTRGMSPEDRAWVNTQDIVKVYGEPMSWTAHVSEQVAQGAYYDTTSRTLYASRDDYEREQSSLDLQFEHLKVAANWRESSELKPNPDKDKVEEYEALELAVLGKKPKGGYQCRNHAKAYAEAEVENRKFEFIDEAENLGWKAHLNVALADVQDVATYLSENGYYHKFLVGGEPSDGKVFTIYFGSRKMANKWAKVIAKDLSSYLAKPIDKTEVEFAAGIVGRFACRQKDHPHTEKYTPYGHIGLPLMKANAKGVSAEERSRYLQDPTEEELREVFNELHKDFGVFFNGASV